MADGTVAYAASGNCGDGVTFSVSAGTVTVKGEGAMYDYASAEEVPWYSYRDEISYVVIENGVTNVGQLAFYQCKNLHTVTLPASVTEIGRSAFAECIRLSSITLPKELKTIGENAFGYCQALTSIRIPDKTEYIDYAAFNRCTSLSVITVPKSVKYLGSMAFAHCSDLVSAQINCSLDRIPSWLFYSCDSLKTVTFASNVQNVGENSLAGCDSLQAVTFNNKEQNVQQLKEESEKATEENAEKIPSDRPQSFAGETGTVVAPDEEKDVTQTSGAVIAVVTPTESEDNATEVFVIIEADSGAKDAADTLKEHIAADSEETATVNLVLKNNNILSKDILKNLAGKNAVLQVTTRQNNVWTFDCRDITGDKFVDMDLTISYSRKETVTEQEKKTVGEAACYALSFCTDIYYNTEVNIYTGTEYARDYATLYISNNGALDKLQSVLVDDEHRASFALAGGCVAQGYVVAMNVENQQIYMDAYIPENMQGEYTGLMDENGTRYVVTGHKSAWGIELNEFTRYVVVFFVAVVIIVGSVTYVVSKQRQIKEKYKR